MYIILRLDEANKIVINNIEMWQQFQPETIMFNYTSYRFSCETIVYHLRRSCDELISLAWFMQYYQKEKKYPDSIKIDCIGKFINLKHDNYLDYEDYKWMLTVLNDIANAYKHSFINSDMPILIGKYEPCIPALVLEKNKLNNNAKIYNVSLKEIIKEFNIFFISFRELILSNSIEIRKQNNL